MLSPLGAVLKDNTCSGSLAPAAAFKGPSAASGAGVVPCCANTFWGCAPPSSRSGEFPNAQQMVLVPGRTRGMWEASPASSCFPGHACRDWVCQEAA